MEAEHVYGRRANHVCLDCKTSAKSKGNSMCPTCGEAMTNIGMKLRAPKKRDKAGWDYLAAIVSGWRRTSG